MSRQKVLDRQERFDGGLNIVSDISALEANQFRKSTNARIVEYGGITKRNGSFVREALPIADPVNGLFLWNRDDGSTSTLAVADGTLYENTDNELLSPWADRGGVSVNASLAVFQKFRNATGDDTVYIAVGSRLNSWDGVTIDSTVGANVDVTTIRVHNQRLWGAGDSTFTNTLFYSGLDNGDSLGDTGNGGGEIIVRTFGDSRIIGLASSGSSLLIFHERGISRLTGYGQDDINLEPQALSADTGLIAPGSIVEVDGGVFFISDRGVFFATEGGVKRLGTPSRPDPIQALLDTGYYNSIPEARACFRRNTNEVLFLVVGYGAFVYNLVLGTWCGPWTGEWTTVAAFTTGTFDDSPREFLVTGFLNGACRFSDEPLPLRDGQTEGEPTTGTAIDWLVTMRRFFFGDETTIKALRHGYLTARLPSGMTLEIGWKTDTRNFSYSLPAPTGTAWGSFIWGAFTWGRAGTKNYRIPMGGSGYFTDVTLASSDDGKPVISRWMVEAFTLGRR